MLAKVRRGAAAPCYNLRHFTIESVTSIGAIFRNLPRDRPWLGLASGAACFGAAAALRWLLGGWALGFGPMLFLPVILISGLIGGLRIALGFGVVSVLFAWVWFFPPYGTFFLTSGDIATMVVFFLTACLEVYVVRTLNVAIYENGLARQRSDTLFRELQHRVANNLQSVAALLQLRKNTLEPGSAGALALEAAHARLDLMAHVHRILHDPNATCLPLDRHLERVCSDIIKASDVPNIQLTVQVMAITLDLESLMSVSLIVAELVTNSLKHAFHNRPGGKIAVSLDVRKQTCTLTVADDGSGLPKVFGRARSGSDTGLGQALLRSLASQLGGEITFERGQGTIARVRFPARPFGPPRTARSASR